MNPFDLPGPQFLTLYFFLGVLTLAALWLARQAVEGGDPPNMPLSDPYVIAYLRGGSHEVLRTAVLVMLDRELLETRENDQIAARPGAASHATNDVEREILLRFEQPAPVAEVFDSARLATLARHRYEPDLVRLGLLPDSATQAHRALALLIALAVLGGTALVKIGVGISRGRPIGFLLVAAIIFCCAAIWLARSSRTARGDRCLADLQQLFDAVRNRGDHMRAHASTSELALLAALFGLGAVPAGQYPFAQMIAPRSRQQSGSSCGSTTGSCGSSCGGGCGGGCGGCGG